MPNDQLQLTGKTTAPPSRSTDLAPHEATAAATGIATSASGRRIQTLSGRQKAAILVRLLIDEGADLRLTDLSEDQQAALTEEIAQLRLVDRATVATVAREFVETLEQVGLSFSGGIQGALAVLGERLSPEAAERLKQRARAQGHANPWERIASVEPSALLELLEGEADEVAAVVLSKLPVSRAAGLLNMIPGERARRIALAMPLTESVAPGTVTRIGAALARQLDDRPRPAFRATPGERFGAILNETGAHLRDTLLAELSEGDGAFAAAVRRNILTFAQLPERLKPRDVPKALRDIGQDGLITAFAYSLSRSESAEAAAANFFLENMSQRVATALRDEIETREPISARDGEAALSAIVTNIRGLIDAGEITLRPLDEEE